MRRKTVFIVTPALIVVLAATAIYFALGSPRFVGLFKKPLPSERPYKPSPTVTLVPSATRSPLPSVSELPSAVNLKVPFTSQAPFKNWVPPYKEFCEEASVFMAISYIRGQDIPSPEFADQKMLEIRDFEVRRFGYYEDTTVAETAIILKEHFGYSKYEIVNNPSEELMKKALVEGRVIVMPAAGRELGNPHFTPPGPLYHMLVIKGFTKGGDFITNDPGTQFGADYIYKPDVLINAIHDWNGGDVYNGKKVILIVG